MVCTHHFIITTPLMYQSWLPAFVYMCIIFIGYCGGYDSTVWIRPIGGCRIGAHVLGCM